MFDYELKPIVWLPLLVALSLCVCARARSCVWVWNNAINQTNDFQKNFVFRLLRASHARISDFLRALVHFRINTTPNKTQTIMKQKKRKRPQHKNSFRYKIFCYLFYGCDDCFFRVFHHLYFGISCCSFLFCFIHCDFARKFSIISPCNIHFFSLEIDTPLVFRRFCWICFIFSRLKWS